MQKRQSAELGGVDQGQAPEQRRGEDIAAAKDDRDGHDGHLIRREGSPEGERQPEPSSRRADMAERPRGGQHCQHRGVCVTIVQEPRGRKAGQTAKNPTQQMGRGCLKEPCLTLLVARRSLRDGYRGRSPDLRITLLANAFPAVSWPVACPVGFRPRSQWRVREGLAPSSRQPHLYSGNSHSVQGSII